MTPTGCGRLRVTSPVLPLAIIWPLVPVIEVTADELLAAPCWAITLHFVVSVPGATVIDDTEDSGKPGENESIGFDEDWDIAEGRRVKRNKSADGNDTRAEAFGEFKRDVRERRRADQVPDEIAVLV